MILVDSRIGSSQLTNLLPAGTFELTQLDFGDVIFDGNGRDGPINIIVERKEIGDFVHSMRSGRLVDYQLPGMLEWGDVIYIIVEGIIKRFRDQTKQFMRNKWTQVKYALDYAEVSGYIFSLQEFTPVRVVQTADLQDTADMIVALSNYWSKLYSAHQSINTVYTGHAGTQVFGRMPLRRRFACLLPGIKGGLSRDIADKFNSVSDMINADEQEWLKVPGIGPKRAERIHNILKLERM